MSPVLLGLAAGAATLRWFGACRRWPWRIAELDRSAQVRPVREVRAGRAVPAVRRTRRGVRAGRAPRSDRAATERLERDLPAAADLLRIATTAGHSLHTAVVEVAGRGAGPVAEALGLAVEGYERGGRLVDELERLPARVGPALRPLTTTLVVAASSGAPLAPQLQRLADTERRRLRRRTEERVRRLPVLLLAPLVGLILPAFVLLTVLPVGITTARTGLEPLAPPDVTSPDHASFPSDPRDPP